MLLLALARSTGSDGVGKTSECQQPDVRHIARIRSIVVDKPLLPVCFADASMSRRTLELQSTIAHALSASLHRHLFPNSSIAISLHVLSQDGSLLAALINAATLACVDAGIPMTDYVVACTAGSTSTYAANDEGADPLLDMNQQEETELPGLTVATLGDSDRIAVLVCESRVQVSRLEGMLAVGVDGCKQIKAILDKVVREKGIKMIQEGTVEKGVDLADMDID